MSAPGGAHRPELYHYPTTRDLLLFDSTGGNWEGFKWKS